MLAVLKGATASPHESHVGFVHERSRLQRQPGILVRHLGTSQHAQFVVDDREERVRTLARTIFELGE